VPTPTCLDRVSIRAKSWNLASRPNRECHCGHRHGTARAGRKDSLERQCGGSGAEMFGDYPIRH
jgi:hypothetical protein